jgi:hypothetical protein
MSLQFVQKAARPKKIYSAAPFTAPDSLARAVYWSFFCSAAYIARVLEML